MGVKKVCSENISLLRFMLTTGLFPINHDLTLSLVSFLSFLLYSPGHIGMLPQLSHNIDLDECQIEVLCLTTRPVSFFLSSFFDWLSNLSSEDKWLLSG